MLRSRTNRAARMPVIHDRVSSRASSPTYRGRSRRLIDRRAEGQTISRLRRDPYDSLIGAALRARAVGFGQALLCSGQHDVVGRPGPQPATWETAFRRCSCTRTSSPRGQHDLPGRLWRELGGPRSAVSSFSLLPVRPDSVALALQVLVAPDSATPLLGASGTIAAVLGAYIRASPAREDPTLVVAMFRLHGCRAEPWIVVSHGSCSTRSSERSASRRLRRPRRRLLLRALGWLAFGVLHRVRASRTPPDPSGQSSPCLVRATPAGRNRRGALPRGRRVCQLPALFLRCFRRHVVKLDEQQTPAQLRRPAKRWALGGRFWRRLDEAQSVSGVQLGAGHTAFGVEVVAVDPRKRVGASHRYPYVRCRSSGQRVRRPSMRITRGVTSFAKSRASRVNVDVVMNTPFRRLAWPCSARRNF